MISDEDFFFIQLKTRRFKGEEGNFLQKHEKITSEKLPISHGNFMKVFI